MQHKNNHTHTLILEAGQGRVYHCGTMTAVFKADENETRAQYSVSEWWLEPGSGEPGVHAHQENDEIFYVLEGCITFFVTDKWIDAPKGTFLRIPANTLHDFKNSSGEKAGFLNFFTPGGFERNMPAIVQWFKEQP